MTAVLGALLFLQTSCSRDDSPGPNQESEPVPVSVTEVQYQSLPAIIDAPGTVQPRNRISLASQINGFVREVHVRAGDPVRRDQVLAALDARDAMGQQAAAQAAIGEAEAALSEARRAHEAAVEMRTAAKASANLAAQTLSRYQKLYESRSVSPQEIDEVKTRHSASVAELASRESMIAAAEDRTKQAQARIAQARAQAARSEVMMSWTTVKAPDSGIVVQRLADPGTAIFPGTPLFVIESTAKPQVLADVPTEYASILRPGLAVKLRSDLTPGAMEGRITEIVPTSNPSTHNIQFKIDLPPNAQAASGQFMKVEVPAGRRNALLVPRTAVRKRGQLTGVFAVNGSSRAHFRLVKTTPFDAEKEEILSGIEPGEMIVSSLNDRITDGVPVRTR